MSFQSFCGRRRMLHAALNTGMVTEQMTKRPFAVNDGSEPPTRWTNTQNVCDTDADTYMESATSNSNDSFMLLFYDFTDIPQDAVVTGVLFGCKYCHYGRISYRIVRNVSEANINSYTVMVPGIVIDENSTYVPDTYQMAFTEGDTYGLVEQLNADMDILREEKQFAVRFYVRFSDHSYRTYLYDVPITITYQVPAVR